MDIKIFDKYVEQRKLESNFNGGCILDVINLR